MIDHGVALAFAPTFAPVFALADGPLFGLPLPELWFALVFALLGTFLFLDGFDFGVGVLFTTREDDAEREQLLAAIGPFWDGNEVWLVVFGGALFAAFPSVYAALFSRHYLLMFCILAALLFRGLAPEMYEQRHDPRWRRAWGLSFVAGSAAAPFFVGMFAANWMLGATATFTVPGVVVGVAVVAYSVVAGAAFLGVKTRGSLPRETAAVGLRALGAYLVLVVLTLGYVVALRPALRPDVLSPGTAAVVLAAVVAAGVVAWGLRTAAYRVALAGVGGLAYTLVGLVAVLLYPFVDRVAGLRVEDAIVSTLPLNLMSIFTAILLPLVVGYFVVLYGAFAGPVDADETY